jgi:1,4-alpha-glucan branching enzyme
MHLIREGNHHKVYEKLGSHFRIVNGIGGIHFAVWAPSALRVSVVGDFNDWDGRKHVMRCLGDTGVFEIFVPGIGMKEHYKYEIKTQQGFLLEKTDPCGYRFEVRPKTAAITCDIEGYKWSDDAWMKERSKADHASKPMAILEPPRLVHARRGGATLPHLRTRNSSGTPATPATPTSSSCRRSSIPTTSRGATR